MCRHRTYCGRVGQNLKIAALCGICKFAMPETEHGWVTAVDLALRVEDSAIF